MPQFAIPIRKSIRAMLVAWVWAAPAVGAQCPAPPPATLTATNPAANDSFGISVSVSNELAVVGASGDDGAGMNSGTAYVYRLDGSKWALEAALTASDAVAGDIFGEAVAVSDDVVVIGASQHEPAGFRSGSAYVFRFDGAGWIEEAKLTASDAAAYDQFGRSVAVSGDVIVIGAFSNDDAGTNSGSAYVFRFDGTSWPQEAKLTASNAAQGDEFGTAVAVDGDGAVGITDLLALLSAWGPCPDPPETCPADLDGDSAVGITDFLILLANWG